MGVQAGVLSTIVLLRKSRFRIGRSPKMTNMSHRDCRDSELRWSDACLDALP